MSKSSVYFFLLTTRLERLFYTQKKEFTRSEFQEGLGGNYQGCGLLGLSRVKLLSK